MRRRVRLGVLLVLAAVMVPLELRLAVSSLRFLADPAAAHAWLPVNSQLEVHTKRGGLEVGDRLVAVEGKALRSRADSYRAILEYPLGTRVSVDVMRGGQALRTWTTVNGRGTRLGWLGLLYVVVVNAITPLSCVALGLFVVYRRPLDGLAWWVLLLLAGQAQFNSFLFVVDGWGMVWSVVFRLMGVLWLMGGIGWLWFGLEFAGRREKLRWMEWARWPLTAVMLYIGAVELVRALGSEFPAMVGVARSLVGDWGRGLLFGSLTTAIVSGFASLAYKMSTETRPDELRRLRLLVAGLLVGRGPLMVLEWIRFVTGVDVFNDDRYFLVTILAALLMFLVPATLAYVLVVDRAMDVGVVVRQGVQYALARRSVEVALVVLAGMMTLLLASMMEDPETSRSTRVAVLAAFVMGIALLQPAARWLRGWLDRKFFREAVKGEQLLGEVAEELRSIVEPGEVAATLRSRVAAALHAERVEVWLDGAAPVAVMERVREGGAHVRGNGTGDGAEWLREAGAEMVVPVAGRERTLGVLTVGARRSEEPYTDRDLWLVGSAAHQAGLALENARLAEKLAHEAAQHERIQRELEIARDVQMRLLPKKEPVIAGVETSGSCRPAQSVGGDSYDYLTLGNGRYALAIGDVSGKGVPAALLMSNLQAALRGLTASGTYPIPQLLAKLNELIYDSTPASRFITFLYCEYETETRRWRCATAGHNPAALLRKGAAEVEWLRTKGIGLGLRRVSAYEELERTLAVGDVVLLYTDGLTEAVNPESEEFGEERLGQALLRHRGCSADEMRKRIVAEVDAFAGTAPQHDDMTLIVMRVTG